VLREVYRVLAPGGEMYFSDVYCDRRLPAEVGGWDADERGLSLAAG
jgi:SAM-dependent methyltransferase